MSFVLPPRKKHWRPGRVQVGLFIRDERGEVVEMSDDNSPPDVASQARTLLLAMCRPRERDTPQSDANGEPIETAPG